LTLPIDPGDYRGLLTTVSEQAGRVPHGGLNYGVLRYLSDHAGPSRLIKKMPAGEVIFLYLGQFDHETSSAATVVPIRSEGGLSQDPEALNPHLFEITALVADGQFRFEWKYSRNIHRRETVQQLVDALHGHLLQIMQQQPATSGPNLSAVDYSSTDLGPAELTELLNELNDV
jgi:non-ribosomal peptide synthase protein (TIGR01720 family)